MDEVTALQARVTELEGQVQQLVAAIGHGGARSPDAEPGGEPTQDGRRVDRRRALGLAAGAATAGVAAAALGPTGPAAAANGQPLVLGSVNNTATAPTGLAANHLGYGIGCTDRGLNALPSDLGGAIFGHTKGNYHGGVLGYSENAEQVGVAGISAGGRAVEAWTRQPGGEPALFALAGGTFGSPEGTAIEGQGRLGVRAWSGESGTAVCAVVGDGNPRPPANGGTAIDAQGLGASVVGVRARGGRAPLLLVPQGVAPRLRSNLHQKGEVVADSTGALWYCVAGGAPGTWRLLAAASSVGALEVLPVPKRVYDSRPGTQPPNGPKTPLSAGVTRTIDLKPNGGVPAGATAALVTVQLQNAANGSGNLTIWSNAVAAKPPVNTLVWAGGAGRFSTLAVSAVDASARVRVNASLGTDLVLDVVGFYR